jgi:hypothetical protein
MADASTALKTLESDLRVIFGARLQSLVHYGVRAHKTAHTHTHGHHEPVLLHALAVVEALTPSDLGACTKRITSWHDEGLATPLILPAAELTRSLDVFPFEFSAILADHVVVAGKDPFAGLRVEPSDLRWACEVQARGHLLHLRQGYVETRGRGDALAVLIVRSAPAWASLLENVARLENQPAPVDDIAKLVGVKEISNDDAVRMFPSYLDAVERLTNHVDGWSATK